MVRTDSFNPLDRGNLYLILNGLGRKCCRQLVPLFQSPRSGKFVSDYIDDDEFTDVVQTRPKFQSPRSGKFVSDFYKCSTSTYSNGDVSIP